MYGVAPIFDDDDVELMFELVLSSGVKNSVVELYLEKVLIDDGLVGKMSVDVDVDVPIDVLNSSYVQEPVVPRELGEVIIVSQDVERRGENVDVSEEEEESGGSSKKTVWKRVSSRGKNKGEDSGIPLFRSFDVSCMVATPRERVFTVIGDVLHVTDLKKGMVFATREEMVEIVYQVHLRNQLEVKSVRKSSCRWTVHCKRRADGCIWSLRATKRKRHGFFEIMKIWGSHTCVKPNIAEDHANMMICSNIEDIPNPQDFVDPSA